MMAVPFEEIMQGFSPERRARIERRAETMLTQNRTLAGLRKTLGVTQRRLADALETSQSNVAQIEGKTDVMVSTVARVVDALGGKLHLVVTLSGRDAVALRIGGGPDEPQLEKTSIERERSKQAAPPRRGAAAARPKAARARGSNKIAGKRKAGALAKGD
jgi:hypothetical protein